MTSDIMLPLPSSSPLLTEIMGMSGDSRSCRHIQPPFSCFGYGRLNFDLIRARAYHAQQATALVEALAHRYDGYVRRNQVLQVFLCVLLFASGVLQ